ncbi:type III restriction protein res subunit [Niastella koreensis GR20-10]|uniref:Type III restriction protein res subunit n=2 Tax=Niastella koreensis TaxID=354356 RepID=G8TMC5_NIAKG|nr:type III restriction protein res subunit [Niastella koreensis GR20-10]
MITPLSNESLHVFRSLFKGRQDVFAIRWEKDGRSGYMPAYDLNWEELAIHKANGGTLKDFANKSYSPLTEKRLLNHLSGKEVIGLYPLLPDNSSWFITADFDETESGKISWQDEVKKFIDTCEKYKLPVYLERSRSGRGGHVWLFFENTYSAFKSRKIMLHMLESTGIISPFDKNSNYDRLFPNQDSHSGKGIGNLIALPLQKKPLENDNSCFIDPVSYMSYPDQWSFLQTIKKVSIRQLEDVYNSIIGSDKTLIQTVPSNPGILQITLNNNIKIPRVQLNPGLVNFLRDSLNFVNSEYIIKKKLGKNTFGTEAYFRMLEEKDGHVFIPRGFIRELLLYCKEKRIQYQLNDERKKLTEVKYSFKGSLYDYQQAAVDTATKKEMGIIVAPPGSGKTVIGLSIIAQKKQPALIIVHRKQLFDQWIERIQSFLGIAEPFIGKIVQGQQKTGAHITVAMIQSVAGINASDDIFKSFGTIIIDECHHVPAKTFRQVISNFHCYYLYGLTATPIRKNNDEKLIFIHIGEVIHEMKLPTQNNTPVKKVSIIIRETELLVPFDYKPDKAETLLQILIHDSSRNRLIIDDIISEVKTGKNALVLTERKAHIQTLYQYLKTKFEVITISGEDPESAKKTKFSQINSGNFQVLISTGQFLGEGADIPSLDCLVLAYPFSFEGKMIQYLGRVQRSEAIPVIYDYRDIHVDYLEKLFKQRSRYYQKLLQTGEIHRLDELILIFNEDKVFINTDATILQIDQLDLPIQVEKFKTEVAWKIRVLKYDEENSEIRAEIIDYAANPQINTGNQISLQFQPIDKIRFRSLDTARLLHAVELKRFTSPQKVFEQPNDNDSQQSFKTITKPAEWVVKKIMKVPFPMIQFSNACVAFSIFIEELNHDIKFEIENPDIRPEFEAVKDYFIKILKKKLITTEIEIRYNENQILSATASSEDINKINSSIIDSVRFEFVKKRILPFKTNNDESSMLHTSDTLLTQPLLKKMFKSDKDLIDDILSVKDSKHYQHLKFLAAQHLSSVLKIRFVLQPFSFLFLLQGEMKYHIVWETLNSEEATYVWHFEKTMDALRNGLSEIEDVLNEIKNTGKQDYLNRDHTNFSRIMHDYSAAQKGFVVWKGFLEQRLI